MSPVEVEEVPSEEVEEVSPVEIEEEPSSVVEVEEVEEVSSIEVEEDPSDLEEDPISSPPSSPVEYVNPPLIKKDVLKVQIDQLLKQFKSTLPE